MKKLISAVLVFALIFCLSSCASEPKECKAEVKRLVIEEDEGDNISSQYIVLKTEEGETVNVPLDEIGVVESIPLDDGVRNRGDMVHQYFTVIVEYEAEGKTKTRAVRTGTIVDAYQIRKDHWGIHMDGAFDIDMPLKIKYGSLNYTVEEITKSTIKVSWDKNSNVKSFITSIAREEGQVSNFIYSNEAGDYTFENLTPGSTYSFSVGCDTSWGYINGGTCIMTLPDE